MVPIIIENYILITKVSDIYNLVPKLFDFINLVIKLFDFDSLVLKVSNFDSLALFKVSQHFEFIREVGFWIFCFYLREIRWQRIVQGL